MTMGFDDPTLSLPRIQNYLTMTKLKKLFENNVMNNYVSLLILKISILTIFGY